MEYLEANFWEAPAKDGSDSRGSQRNMKRLNELALAINRKDSGAAIRKTKKPKS